MQLGLDKPLGLTCQHAYSLGEIGGQVRVARVALNSLGPGTPPD